MSDSATADAPLAGLKVVEITTIYSGPLAGMLLAELGAEVIKVESPDAPDVVRTSGIGAGPDDVNPTFYSLNRGKRFLSLDGKTERGRELLADLVAAADIFVHNMRPGRPEHLGLGYEEMAARNPRLIYAAISGMGNEGPEAHLPAYDYVLQAKTGMVDYQRNLDSGHSDLVHQVVVDKTAANGLVQGILAALYVRERTGKGQRIDVPMIAASLAFLWPDGFAPAHSQLEGPIPLEMLPPWIEAAPGSFLVVMPTLDGEIATGILLPPWDGLCLALDRLDWVTDERFADQTSRALNLPALIEEVRSEVAKLTTDEVLARFAEHDFAAGKVASRRDVHLDPTVQHLGLISTKQNEHLGEYRQPAPMWTFSDTAAVDTDAIGRTGADSREILGEMGLDGSAIDQLLADNVIYVSEMPEAT